MGTDGQLHGMAGNLLFQYTLWHYSDGKALRTINVHMLPFLEDLHLSCCASMSPITSDRDKLTQEAHILRLSKQQSSLVNLQVWRPWQTPRTCIFHDERGTVQGTADTQRRQQLTDLTVSCSRKEGSMSSEAVCCTAPLIKPCPLRPVASLRRVTRAKYGISAAVNSSTD